MDKKGVKVISGILLALVVVGAFVGFFLAKANKVEIGILNAIALVAAVCGGIYVFSGATKEKAKFFEVYGMCLMVIQLVGVVSAVISGKSIFCIVGSALALVFSLVLGFRPNLGKAKSSCLAGILCVFDAITVVMLIISADVSLSIIIGTVVMAVMALAYIAAVSAKYADKAARGTK